MASSSRSTPGFVTKAKNSLQGKPHLLKQTELPACSHIQAAQLDQIITGAVQQVGRDLHRSPHRAD
jgi:hypothetical protein